MMAPAATADAKLLGKNENDFEKMQLVVCVRLDAGHRVRLVGGRSFPIQSATSFPSPRILKREPKPRQSGVQLESPVEATDAF